MTASPPSGPANAGSLARKYLTFTLGRESYGLAAIKVREIIRFMPTTFVPQLPPHIRGVINLRGQVIPVLDLRMRLGMSTTACAERGCIVVLPIKGAAPEAAMGIVVDGVEEVLQIAPEDVEPAPDFGAGPSADYILGIAKIGQGMKTLLDIDRLLAESANL